jgi:DNA topoisomerase IA
LTTDAFHLPKAGKTDDQSHPPIHPTKYTNELTDKHKAIYELIVRHFLATCSDDAIGRETTVHLLINSTVSFLLSLSLFSIQFFFFLITFFDD